MFICHSQNSRIYATPDARRIGGIATTARGIPASSQRAASASEKPLDFGSRNAQPSNHGGWGNHLVAIHAGKAGLGPVKAKMPNSFD
jgi:hypothetical protein